MSNAQGGGGTLTFSYIRRLKPFWVFKNLEFQYFWVLSEKGLILVHKDCVDIFWGHHKLKLV